MPPVDPHVDTFDGWTDANDCLLVTRSHKYTDRDHVGLADGTAAPEEHLPRYFAKTGHVDSDPKKTKKDGGGKANWYVPFSNQLILLHHQCKGNEMPTALSP